MNKVLNRALLGFALGMLLAIAFYPVIGAWVYLACIVSGIWVGIADL